VLGLPGGQGDDGGGGRGGVVGNSTGMEVCGAKTVLEFLDQRGALPHTFGTDRSPSVR
jgi:hypothetical protein